VDFSPDSKHNRLFSMTQTKEEVAGKQRQRNTVLMHQNRKIFSLKTSMVDKI